MKLAIVYDWIDKWGGAERILELVFRAFPQADLYTLYADFDQATWARPYQHRIKTTFLQRFYDFRLPKQLLAPLMPMATESLNLSDYDAVLSLSSSFMKGVITRPETKHLCYLFAPTRFLWHQQERFFSRNFWLRPFLNYLRQWDYIAARRPDQILTLSRYDQQLIAKYYRVNSEILYPPFAVDYWQGLAKEQPKHKLFKNYFLLVSRLEPNKDVDLAIKVFNQQKDKQLVIVGQGTQETSLKSLASANVTFLKQLDDKHLAWLYAHAQALLMPQAEDFGYTALEAIAFNTPVISFRESGTAEILAQTKTGYLFNEQSVDSLMNALENYHTKSYNFSNFNWSKYSSENFINQLKQNISS